MDKRLVAPLIGVLAMSFDASAEEPYPELSKRIAHLTARLRSGRWEARYCLLGELSGRDAETRRALEALARDTDERVANQALVRYVGGFVVVDRALFRPALAFPRRFPVASLPAEDPDRALVEYCLGRRKIEPRDSRRDDPFPAIPVLDAAHLDDPRMHDSLTVVGILGKAEDADALHPFLQSPNPHVALGAAKAVLRLGQKAKGVEALRRLTQLDPSKDLYYVTESVRVLEEVGHPGLDAIVRRVLATIDAGPPIQPDWVSGFLVVAAEVVGAEVWTSKDGSGSAGAPK